MGADGDAIQIEVTLEYNDGESIVKTASVMQMEQITNFRLKASSYDITANSLWDLGSEIEVDSGEASMSYVFTLFYLLGMILIFFGRGFMQIKLQS